VTGKCDGSVGIWSVGVGDDDRPRAGCDVAGIRRSEWRIEVRAAMSKPCVVEWGL
jgi:hypothetical protein